jgi:hypothetical protein
MRRLTYANVMATLALFFALTGGAAAVNKYLTAQDPISGGDLAGSTYASPVIAAGAVTSPKLADGSVTTSKFDSSATAPNAARLGELDVVPGTCLAGTCTIRNVQPGESIGGVVACSPNRIPITVLMSAPDVRITDSRTLDTRHWLEIDVHNFGTTTVESLTWTPLCLG